MTENRPFEHRGEVVAFVKEIRDYTRLTDAVDATIRILTGSAGEAIPVSRSKITAHDFVCAVGEMTGEDALQRVKELVSANDKQAIPVSPTPERDHRMNRAAFEKLIAENLTWLEGLPYSLERSHVHEIVRNCVKYYYPASPASAVSPTEEP